MSECVFVYTLKEPVHLFNIVGKPASKDLYFFYSMVEMNRESVSSLIIFYLYKNDLNFVNSMDLPMMYILFTGATSGIGEALIKSKFDELCKKCRLHYIVACRNMKKGEKLKSWLAVNQPLVEVTLVEMDVSLVKSVKVACHKIKTLFPHIDCMFLNAGIMPVANMNWEFIKGHFFSWEFIEALRTGNKMFTSINHNTSEGIKSIFATNVLGHYIIVQDLEELLAKAENSKIIWTTSTNASRKEFNPLDVTCANGVEPYSSSKYVLNATSMELNRRLNDKHIYSHLADPGTVLTNITFDILPAFVWYLLMPVMFLLRFALPELTITPQNACSSMKWLLNSDPQTLKPNAKYCSRSTVTNSVYVQEDMMDITWEESAMIFDLLEKTATDLEIEK